MGEYQIDCAIQPTVGMTVRTYWRRRVGEVCEVRDESFRVRCRFFGVPIFDKKRSLPLASIDEIIRNEVYLLPNNVEREKCSAFGEDFKYYESEFGRYPFL